MTYLGTRPILPDELEQYELHHRARIAIKPGITGMWQVSGRSDITDFEEIVRLDTEYISEWNIGLDIKIKDGGNGLLVEVDDTVGASEAVLRIHQEIELRDKLIAHAVDAALNLYDLLHGKGDLEAWKKMQKKSLCSGFNDADSSAIIAWNKRMQELVRMDEIAKDIRYGKPVKETAALAII